MDGHRPCGCLAGVVGIMAPMQHESVVTFENVLKVAQGVMQQWETTIHDCTRCLSDPETTATLTVTAVRLFTLFRASCMAYSTDEGDFNLDNPAAENLTLALSKSKSDLQQTNQMSIIAGSTRPVVCQQSQMTFGQLNLDTNESRLLAEQLLVEGLSRLNGLLEDLKELAEDQWSGNGWNQLSKGQLAIDALINRTMDSSMALIGRMKSSGRRSGVSSIDFV
ncbi:hypothetical protein B0O99DRAFT_748870 [Bisporella sp. PMI_857]|nr:hypothetical protein B0O99DRAFT_748870 [Bisporella sp. PMI_857]